MGMHQTKTIEGNTKTNQTYMYITKHDWTYTSIHITEHNHKHTYMNNKHTHTSTYMTIHKTKSNRTFGLTKNKQHISENKKRPINKH